MLLDDYQKEVCSKDCGHKDYIFNSILENTILLDKTLSERDKLDVASKLLKNITFLFNRHNLNLDTVAQNSLK